MRRVTETVATPLALMIALPLKEPPEMSAPLIPERVYGTEVPEARLVVESVKVTEEPSSTEVLPALNAYEAVDLDVSLITVEAVAPPAVMVRVS